MTKILKDSTYDELKAKADGYDAIVAKLGESSEGFDLSEFTADSIIEIIESGAQIDDALAAETQKELETAQARITELETELETANARVTELEQELDETPAEQSAEITAKGENGGEEQDIAKFADKNKGDTASILAQAQKEGLI